MSLLVLLHKTVTLVINVKCSTTEYLVWAYEYCKSAMCYKLWNFVK